ncbi:MAG: acyl carrier protein [Nitrospira sp.]|nr:acyl carrier protein [Nitrospira sp.]
MDSVAHINLMFGIEQAFGIRFKGNELADMKNIGELKQFLSGRVKPPDMAHLAGRCRPRPQGAGDVPLDVFQVNLVRVIYE